MKEQGITELYASCGSHLLTCSFPGSGGVLLPDPGHVGVLFPLCPASKCLPGSIPGLPPEPSGSQYPLKDPLDLPRPMKLQLFSQGMGSGVRADEQTYGGIVQG